ncbi:MAG: ABC transporter permease [Bryobacterales bacterium]|nr:ABC transporter permease [Bryobacterales bacterium]
MTSTGHRWLDMCRQRAAALWRSRSLDAEMAAEMQFHIENLEREYVAAGLSPAEARRRARIEFGGVAGVMEETRDARGFAWLDALWQDVRFALRSLRRTPLVTFTIVATVGLGIGVTATVFTFLYSAMYRPLPVADSERFVNIHVEARGEGARQTIGTMSNVSTAEYRQMRAASKTADVMAAAEIGVRMQGSGERQLRGLLATENLLPGVGGRPILGRFFTESETGVVVLQNELWRSRFGSDPNVVGRVVTLNRTPFTVIGVTDGGTHAPVAQRPDFWIPYTMQPALSPSMVMLTDTKTAWLQLFGRLRPGARMEDAQAELGVLAGNALRAEFPKKTPIVTVVRGSYFNFPKLVKTARIPSAMLFVACGLMMLLVCANVANLLLARGLARTREMAIRVALGAGRARLVRLLWTESALLGAMAGAAALAVVSVGGPALLALVEIQSGPLALDARPDGVVVAFLSGLCLLTAVVFGAAPALQTLRTDLQPGLRSEGAVQFGPRRRWLQSGLVMVQVTACAVLLVGAGLLVRGLQRGMNIDVGMAREGVSIVSLDLGEQQYTPERARGFLRELQRMAMAQGGVEAAAVSSLDPFVNSCDNLIQVSLNGGEWDRGVMASCQEVGPEFLRVMGIPLRAGRMFTEAEWLRGEKVVVIGEDMAARYFAGRNALGGRIREGDDELVVVGVMAAVRNLDPVAMPRPAYVRPLPLGASVRAKLLIRTRGARDGLLAGLRAAAARLDGGVTVQVKGIEENVNSALAVSRAAAGFAAGLGGLALLLAVFGIYSVVAFATGRRTREVGIRMALGANRADVLRLLMGQGLKPVLAGLAVGLCLALAGAQLLRVMLYGLSPADPLSVGGVALLLSAVAAAASYLPARRATRIAPSQTLRHE